MLRTDSSDSTTVVDAHTIFENERDPCLGDPEVEVSDCNLCHDDLLYRYTLSTGGVLSQENILVPVWEIKRFSLGVRRADHPSNALAAVSDAYFCQHCVPVRYIMVVNRSEVEQISLCRKSAPGVSHATDVTKLILALLQV